MPISSRPTITPSPKGILLYGPPGCGKTLLGKATAYNLTRQLREKTGSDHREYFMHVKGPEILNMWVGESERQVRELFARAREKAKEGFLPFIFIDEAESILGTRRAGRTSGILNTLVPMFCAEMDGIESLQQMVIILASNRADMIDPAILRPGRIDRKIKVSRPTKKGSEEIYRIYITPNLPLDPALLQKHEGNAQAAIDDIIAQVIDAQFSQREENRFLEVTLRSGRHEYLHRGDLVSGAIIAGIVERAKETAIKRAIGSPEPTGLSVQDFLDGAQDRVQAERHLPAQRHHRRLAQAGRLRSGERGQPFARQAAAAGSEWGGVKLQMLSISVRLFGIFPFSSRSWFILLNGLI